mmetsp:Transcript_31824/g.83473  ORF Transcript_31824/g.83473 Transcript_31824/m.83473 type:complete len:238 (-) Transcript_31824:735-1448(-)
MPCTRGSQAVEKSTAAVPRKGRGNTTSGRTITSAPCVGEAMRSCTICPSPPCRHPESPPALSAVIGRTPGREAPTVSTRRAAQRRGARPTAHPDSGRRHTAGAPVLRRGVHHGHELLEIDLAISARVDRADNLFNDLVVSQLLVVAFANHEPELVLGDLAVAVAVEQAERRPANVLLLVQLLVKGGGQEFGIVHDAAAVRIYVIEDPHQVRRDVLEAGLQQSLFQFATGEQAVLVAV